MNIFNKVLITFLVFCTFAFILSPNLASAQLVPFGGPMLPFPPPFVPAICSTGPGFLIFVGPPGPVIYPYLIDAFTIRHSYSVFRPGAYTLGLATFPFIPCVIFIPVPTPFAALHVVRIGTSL